MKRLWVRALSGREYFRRLASAQGIDKLDAGEIAELPALDLKQAPPESRLGSRAGRDLIALTPEQTASQHDKADKLMSHPRRSFAAEHEADERGGRA
jgi:hypothetical protein